MEHEMILLDADFRSVVKRLTARKKVDAGMAEVDMHLSRKEDYSGSTPDASPSSEQT
jgi:hypothetical protein